MKKIIVKTALFIVPFALLYIITLFFYSVNKGDLIRIGFMKDDKNYDQKMVFSNELKEKIHFTIRLLLVYYKVSMLTIHQVQ